MAESGKDDELKEGADAPKQKKPMSGTVKIVLIVFGVLLLLGVNTALVLMVAGGGDSKSSEHDHPVAENEHGGEADPKNKAGDDGGHGDDKSKSNQKAGTPIYYKVEPTFVVNFQAQEALRFLQVNVEVMAREQTVIATVEQHMPVIRNNLILLFSSQDFTTISTRVGKERLRAQVLAEIQKVLKEKTGKPGIEAVYFTSFVMQ